jgi:N-acylneuraminate cytidylyltransferase
MQKPDLTILIPARSGSKRIKDKNIALIGDKPLIAFTIETALGISESSKVIVSTDSKEIAENARSFVATVPGHRPPIFATDLSPDIDWVLHAVNTWPNIKESEFLAILRPTSPLRTASTIIRALECLKNNPDFDSLRAVRSIKEHPGKMWRKVGIAIEPYIAETSILTGAPSHSSPMQALEQLWIQDASLEIVRTKKILETKSIAGKKVLGFEMPNNEGFDINYIEDLEYLRFLLGMQ